MTKLRRKHGAGSFLFARRPGDQAAQEACWRINPLASSKQCLAGCLQSLKLLQEPVETNQPPIAPPLQAYSGPHAWPPPTSLNGGSKAGSGSGLDGGVDQEAKVRNQGRMNQTLLMETLEVQDYSILFFKMVFRQSEKEFPGLQWCKI